MKRGFVNYFIFFVIFAHFCVCIAQEDERVVSPEVHADRTVTFRFYAPDAEEVYVYTQFTDEVEVMKKYARGVWSIRLGPAEPEIYVYGFVVDGIEKV